MTKDEIINIIKQNQDVLNPESYQNILKNVDILNDSDKERIVAYLMAAQAMLKVNNEYMKKQNAAARKATETLRVIDEKMKHDVKEGMQKEEKDERREESEQAEDLLSNL